MLVIASEVLLLHNQPSVYQNFAMIAVMIAIIDNIPAGHIIELIPGGMLSIWLSSHRYVELWMVLELSLFP